MAKSETQPSGSSSAALDELFKSSAAVDSGDFVAALKGKVFLTEGESNRVFLEDVFSKAPNKTRLIAVGLGLHVLHRKGLIGDEGLSRQADWYANQIQAPPKTVLEELSRLKSSKLGVFERTEGGYRIPTWAVRKAIEHLTS